MAIVSVPVVLRLLARAYMKEGGTETWPLAWSYQSLEFLDLLVHLDDLSRVLSGCTVY